MMQLAYQAAVECPDSGRQTAGLRCAWAVAYCNVECICICMHVNRVQNITGRRIAKSLVDVQ